MVIEIDEILYKKIEDYCSINEIPIVRYVNELLKKQFMIDKYGIKPNVNHMQQINNIDENCEKDGEDIGVKTQEDINIKPIEAITIIKTEDCDSEEENTEAEAKKLINERWEQLGMTKGLDGYMKDNITTIFENQVQKKNKRKLTRK